MIGLPYGENTMSVSRVNMLTRDKYHLFDCRASVLSWMLATVLCVLCAITDQDGSDSQRTDKDSLMLESRKDADKKRTFRGITKAVSLAAKLSPKSQRKDKGTSSIAELKVCVLNFDSF